MMAARLPDDVRLARLRESVRKASARRRVKLALDGNEQLLVWIPATVRRQLDGLALARNLSLSAVTTELLSVALTTTPRASTNADAFNQDLAAFKTAVVDHWVGGLRGYGPIATAVANAGYRNSNGNRYTREAVKKALIKAGLVESTALEKERDTTP